MSDLADLRAAVVTSLKDKLKLANIETHGGTFDDKELKRYALNAPAIRVALVGLGASSRHNDGRIRTPVKFSCVIVTKDAVVGSTKIDRDVSALVIATALEIALSGNRFGLSGVFTPTQIDARCEYTGTIDAQGIALWQVTWTSDVLLGVETDGAPPDNSAVITGLMKELVNGVATYKDGALTQADPLIDPPEVSA